MTDKKIYLASIPILILLALGLLNIYKKITWKEFTDGVVWQEKPGGLTAVNVEMDSPAYLAGIKKGDILYAVNNNLIKNKIDITKNIWLAGGSDRKVIYQINRHGELLYPSFYLVHKGVNLFYFYLALIGLTTLAIGIVVFIISKKPFSLPYIYFYLLSLALFSFYTFSPTGELDVLDSIFCWLDKSAFLVFPPLLLHFFLIFPQRKKFIKKRPSSTSFLYFPAFILLLARVILHLPYSQRLGDILILRTYETLEKLDVFHFVLFTLSAFVIVLQSSLSTASPIVKKQLKWIVYGLGFGVIPFTLFYLTPFMFGLAPHRMAELTVLLQALIPLTFAYSISRYKLMDFEVLLKKAATLIFSYFVIATVYFIVSSQTRVFSENKINAVILGILAIVLGATLYTPLKKTFQSLLDMVFYKRSYKYRKTLLFISKEISRERNLDNLSHSLLELIANALSLKSIVLLLPDDNGNNTFHVLKQYGEIPHLPRKIIFGARFFQSLTERDYLSFYSFSEKKDLQKQYHEFSSYHLFHFMPLKVEGKIIGCLGMGKKEDNTFLTSEDWELLTAISSPVALALENAYLYNQVSIRARELERLKDYSENIIESLTVGVAVLDQGGKIIGWNRVLKDIFGRKKEEALGKTLEDLLGRKNLLAIFPPDTQRDYRLLSEITLEMPGGEKRIFDIAKTPLLDNRLNPYGTIIVFEDITEKIHLQQQLLTSEKLASIGLLSAGVAHEINTPLTGISSYVQMLQKKVTDSHYIQILKKIETQTERVSKIIKNLLNFARNPSDTSFYRVSLKDVFQEIISLIEYKLKAMNILLELNLSPVSPVWAQGERLQQIFINIILNAIDAMPGGGTLTIDLAQNNKEAVIKIADTGTGIKDQHLPHIFDPFFTTKGVGKGTGLGLSISYAIIKEHEGHIVVESEFGKGTCFTITLPMDLDIIKKTNNKHSMKRK